LDGQQVRGYARRMVGRVPKFRSSYGVAFAVACLGIAVFSTMDAVVKGLALAIGTYNTLLWRSFVGVPLSGVPWLLRNPPRPSRAAMKLHIERGVVSAVMAMLFFWGLVRTPMAQAVALSFIAPLIAQGLAVVLLGERLKSGALIGSLFGLGGVGVILAGQAQAEMGHDAFLGALAVLLSALCYAYNIILMRRQAQMADPYEVAFFQNITVAICLGLFMPWFADWPAPAHYLQILLAAALATISLFLLSWAYARAEASYLAPTEFTAFLWASLFGYLAFGEHVSFLTIGGAALIIAGCVIAARASPEPPVEREVVP
jgi:S-adenosylmethionine uptake transporter